MTQIKTNPIIQCSVYWVDFDPVVGTEAGKTRPAIVVSGTVQNSLVNRTMVVPVTSNITNIFFSETAVKIGGKKAKAMANQMRYVDKSRLGKYICTITKTELRNIQFAIKIVLELE